MTTDSRPNILFITIDQHRPDCYGFTGKRNIRTPFLDRLAARSTRFEAAITPNVVCQPSRASILTGLLPLTHGVYDNHVSLHPSFGEAGWARTLANVGYRSAFIGKAHFGEHPENTPHGAPESRAMSAEFPTDWNGPYMGFDDVRLMFLGHWHEHLPCEEPPGGHHFGTSHTMARYQTAFYPSMLSSRQNFEGWEEAGSMDTAVRANRIYKTLLAEYEQPPIDAGIEEALRDYTERRKRDIAASSR